MTALVDAYDAALFDLDGVIYIGKDPVPEAPAAVAALRERGVRLGFVTNNASRSPRTVADHLSRIGMPADERDVVTSAQAMARVMARELPAGSRVFVVGTSALADEVELVGLEPVGPDDDPVAMVQGYDPQLTIPTIETACYCIQRGLRWYATNLDISIPRPRGIVPGVGSYVNLMAAACGCRPYAVAGKPFPALIETTVERLETHTPIFVGDRLDTDIEGAHNSQLDSLFVLSGVHGKADLVAAAPRQRPTYLAASVAGLLEPPRVATIEPAQSICGAARVVVAGQRLDVERPGEPLDTLWALATLAWAHPEADASDALAAIPVH